MPAEDLKEQEDDCLAVNYVWFPTLGWQCRLASNPVLNGNAQAMSASAPVRVGFLEEIGHDFVLE